MSGKVDRGKGRNRKKVSDQSHVGVKSTTRQHLTSNSAEKEIGRHTLGSERIPIVRLYFEKKMEASDAAQALSITLSAFYKIVRRVNAHGGDLGAVTARKPGRKSGILELEPEVEQLIEDGIKHYAGKAATIENVWKHTTTLADAAMLPRPSYHRVRKRLQAKGKRFLTLMKLGRTDAADIQEARPHYKETKRPLEWVQIDHTRVDLIVVDDQDRTVILDRPWLSLAICLHTRVILGFYLSLLPPSAVSVAMLMENCVLPKDTLLSSYGLDQSLWPMHGIPEVIHADNAAEFRSDVVKANLKGFEVRMEHRDIGKKHQGGHIERLIGTMMKSEIHFLRGTTYSNTQQRSDEDSEKKASFTMPALRKYLICAIHAYHERKHSGIRMSPAQKWREYYSRHAPAKQVPEERRKDFRYTLYPEKMKLIRSGGIEIHNRFYYSAVLQQRVRKYVLVKFDPYDLGHIFADLDDNGTYTKIPCHRNPFKRSSDYELYRRERQLKGERDGTVSREGTASIALGQHVAKEEYRATAKSKREKTKEAGTKDYQKYTEAISEKPMGTQDLVDQTEHLDQSGRKQGAVKPVTGTNKSQRSRTSSKQGKPGKPASVSVLKPKWQDSNAGRGTNSSFQGLADHASNAVGAIDFDKAPIIY